MAATLSSAFVSTPLVSQRPAVRTQRASLVVRASQPESSRREALSLFAGVLSLGVAGAAQAKIALPFQDSLGGGPKSTTEASSSGYTMEGTKKRGIKPGKKREVMAAAKEAAMKLAQKVTP